MARGVWSGSISFGLVNVAVKALTATRDHDVHFNQLERGTGARIGYEKVSKQSGETVATDDIQLGYEISKGRYVTFERDELETLRPPSSRSIEVDDFVELDAIDPVFFDRTYWLVPTTEQAAHPYRLLAAAMEERGRVGIGSVVMRNKQYLAAIRPMGGALAMSTMRFADEVLRIDDVDEMPSEDAELPSKELKLATQVIDALSTAWEPEKYTDTFTGELMEMINAKDAGNEVVAEAATTQDGQGADIVDLVDALRASVKASKSKSESSGKESRTKKSA